MFPNLETEQERCGYTDRYVADCLGLSERALRARKSTGAFRLSEAESLATLYQKPVAYLFRSTAA